MAAVAIVPPLIAGLVFFQGRALIALAFAVAVGAALHLIAWRLKVSLAVSPAVASTVAVALVGAGAPYRWTAAAALLAGGLDVARQAFLPALRVQAGLIAYSLLFLSGRAEVASYLTPGALRPLAEPVQLWSLVGGGAAAPIDPVRLYVGNVPGPLFATSLMAVVLGGAWLWYARRLSLAVLLAFGGGVAAFAAVMQWNVGYHLDSGPAWFAVALILADRALLPASRSPRPLLGLAAGVIAMAARTRGAGIEAVFLAVAGLQLAVAVVEGAEWLFAHRADLGRQLHGAQARMLSRRGAA